MTQALIFTINEEDDGARVDEFLAARLGRLSRMRIASLVARGACRVGGAAVHAGWRLRAGDAVEFAPPAAAAPGAMTPEDLPLDILHEDEHLLVVVKPAGLLVHPTRGVKTGTLANALTYHLNRFSIFDFRFSIARPGASEGGTDESRSGGPASASAERAFDDGGYESLIQNPKSKIENPKLIRPGLVHRLDRETSGLLVVAKTQQALSSLSRQFHRRRVEKGYLALVGGRVREDALTIEAPIGRRETGPPWWVAAAEGGRPAETRLRVSERGARATLVELEPVTGRTNQLRIHCAHAGHPIAGDAWYGGPPAPRLCLHAARLAFNHPSGGARVSFASPLPAEIAALL